MILHQNHFNVLTLMTRRCFDEVVLGLHKIKDA
jgi:hypothetical protein